MLLAAFDVETVRQLTVDGILRGSAYGLLGAGFALILGVTGRFHFAYGFTYTLAIYMAYTATFNWDVPFWIGAVFGILFAAVVGVLIERIVYRPLVANAGANALLAVFVASLGLGIAGENLIRLLWGSESQAYFGPDQVAYELVGATFLNFDVWQVSSSFALVLILAGLLKWSPLGRQIKATRVNPELARIIGINANTIYLICFFIGTIFAGVAAVWSGLKFTVDPGMGFTPVIYAFVVAFLAGTTSSPIRVYFTGIVVALIEQYSSIWLSVRWTQTAVFVVLVGYLTYLAFKSSAFAARIRRPAPAGRA